MRRTQPSAQANQRRNLLGPVRDRAITKPIPTNRSTTSTRAGVSRSERLVPHRSPPIDLTSDAEDDSERSFATEEEEEEVEDDEDEDEDEENKDEEAAYEDEEDVRLANASPGRANMLSTANLSRFHHIVEESIYTVCYEHRYDYGDTQFSILGSYTDMADANAAVLGSKSGRGFDWDDYREQWSTDGTVSIHGSGEEDNYKVMIRKTRLKRRVTLSR